MTTEDEPASNPEEATADLAADHSVSGMLDETLNRLEATIAESSLLLQDGLADPSSYAARAGKLKSTIFEVQLVVAASLPSDGPVVDALAATAAEAERVVAQLESRANAWSEFSMARDEANKQFDALCLRLDVLWAENKQRQQQNVVVTRQDVNAGYGLLDDLSRHQDTIRAMKKFAQELEPLELPFQEIRSLEDSIPEMARNGQDLVNDLWKHDLEVSIVETLVLIDYSFHSMLKIQFHKRKQKRPVVCNDDLAIMVYQIHYRFKQEVRHSGSSMIVCEEPPKSNFICTEIFWTRLTSHTHCASRRNVVQRKPTSQLPSPKLKPFWIIFGKLAPLCRDLVNSLWRWVDGVLGAAAASTAGSTRLSAMRSGWWMS